MRRTDANAGWPRILAVTLSLPLAGCYGGVLREGGESTTSDTGVVPGSSGPSGSSSGAATSGPADATGASSSGDGELTGADASTGADDDAGAEASSGGSTGAPVPDFEALPWQTDIGYGVAYKDSGDPDARNVFIGYAGYPFPLDAAQAWATELYRVRLAELGVRHVYAVQGPATVMYVDLEIGNTHIAEALQSQAAAAGFVLVAGHSSGSYVAHELLGQLAGGWDPQGVTADKVVYFNLDGGTAFLSAEAVARLRRAYFVSVWDGSTNTGAPNREAMQYLEAQFPEKGRYLELDGSATGCNDGAQWCLHMGVINSRPHDPWDSDVIDYYDYVDRPVVTRYIDDVAVEAGLVP